LREALEMPGPKKVLIVDDDADIVKLLNLRLKPRAMTPARRVTGIRP